MILCILDAREQCIKEQQKRKQRFRVSCGTETRHTGYSSYQQQRECFVLLFLFSLQAFLVSDSPKSVRFSKCVTNYSTREEQFQSLLIVGQTSIPTRRLEFLIAREACFLYLLPIFLDRMKFRFRLSGTRVYMCVVSRTLAHPTYSYATA